MRNRLLGTLVLSLIAIVAPFSTSLPVVHATATSAPKVSKVTKATSKKSTYTNISGLKIHVPVVSTHSVPAGAHAHCVDGTYSFSTHRSGTCSGHHGVAAWL